MARIDDALSAWRDALGEQHVVTDPAALAAAETATYATSQRIAAILRPGTREDVQACVRIANRHRVPLYPISRGKNWGYGSRVPTASGSALLELSRLDRILAYDEDLAYITVEPGVTQEQLFDYLRARGSRLWVDATGSTPLASLVGNIVERGLGITSYGDHVGRACGYEVVLPNGELLHTGFGIFAGAHVSPFDRWAPGPMLEGLFSQSNLGIVVKLTIPLMPAPEVARTAIFDLPEPELLRQAVDAMRGLQLDGTIRSAPWFGNHYRLMGVAMRYPWSEAQAPPLGLAESRRMAAGFGIPPWTGAVGLYGTAGQVALAKRRLRSALRGRARRLRFVDKPSLDEAAISPRRVIELALHRGYSGQLMNAVRRAYWRKRAPPPVDADLDRDRVGFVFISASIPFVGDHVVRASEIAEEVIISYGFEPAINCHSVRERVLPMVVTVAWDRDVVGDDERALASHDELADRWMEAGYFPFRLGVHAMGLLGRAQPSHLETIKAVKKALDPRGILAPGRYGGE